MVTSHSAKSIVLLLNLLNSEEQERELAPIKNKKKKKSKNYLALSLFGKNCKLKKKSTVIYFNRSTLVQAQQAGGFL